MSLSLEKDFELTVKCLHQYNLIPEISLDKQSKSFTDAGTSTKTKRVFEYEDKNPPEQVKSWRAGGIARAFLRLGFELADSRKTAFKEHEYFKSLSKFIESGTDGTDGNGSVKYAKNNEANKGDIPAVHLPRVNEEYGIDGRTNSNSSIVSTQTNRKPSKSRFPNYNPPRKFSPPRPQPSSVIKSSNCSNIYMGKSAQIDQSPNHLRNIPNRHSSKQSLFSTHQEETAKFNHSHDARTPAMNKSKDNNGFDVVKKDNFAVVREPEPPGISSNPFRTAHQQLVINDQSKGVKRTIPAAGTNVHVSGIRKIARLDAPTKVQNNEENKNTDEPVSDNPEVVELMQHPSMKNIEPKMVETVLNEVFDVRETDWDDIAGLKGVKDVIREIIIWPMLRPDIFTGLRGPPKGILLFGPPGTGKTMIGRLIATQSKSAFFNISASSLTSKWIGDGEKMVRALFAVARVKQPAVIFIDEIDSILTQRSDTEHESSRRLKTEFLIQFDGCGTRSDDRILVIGVTNRPQELDEAARRRLVKRIYIPLPDTAGRKQLVKNLLGKQSHCLNEDSYEKIAQLTGGYSGADMATLCQEASYGPIRDVGVDIQSITADEVRPMALKDFETAVRHVKASVDEKDLDQYEDWDKKFGCRQ